MPIPASLVTHATSSDDLSLHPPSGQAGVGALRSDSPSDLSFMMFDEPGTSASSWASRLRSTVVPKSSKDKDKERKGKQSSSPPPASSSLSLLSNRKFNKDADMTRDESSRDRLDSLVSESELGTAVGAGMSDKEKAVARRKAAKLEQLFGDPPPQAMYLPSHRPSMSVNLSRDMPMTSFPTPPTHLPPSNETINGRNGTANGKGEYQTYRASLQNLLHLVETDRGASDFHRRFARAVEHDKALPARHRRRRRSRRYRRCRRNDIAPFRFGSAYAYAYAYAGSSIAGRRGAWSHQLGRIEDDDRPWLFLSSIPSSSLAIGPRAPTIPTN